MERIGECRRCGDCCLQISRFRWNIERIEGGCATVMKIAHSPLDSLALPCKALIFDIKTHQAICARQEEKWKEAMRMCEGYPFLPGDLLPGCGYSFI